MTLGSALARAARAFFGLLVLVNPLSRLDSYLLRHAPIVWRTQFFLISSYALLLFCLLHGWGFAADHRTIAQVPTEGELLAIAWLTLVAMVGMLTPWIYRNVRTQLERGRFRDIALLFGAYSSASTAQPGADGLHPRNAEVACQLPRRPSHDRGQFAKDGPAFHGGHQDPRQAPAPPTTTSYTSS